MREVPIPTNAVNRETLSGNFLVITKDVRGHVRVNGVPILHMKRDDRGVRLSGETDTFVINDDDFARFKALPVLCPPEGHL